MTFADIINNLNNQERKGVFKTLNALINFNFKSGSQTDFDNTVKQGLLSLLAMDFVQKEVNEEKKYRAEAEQLAVKKLEAKNSNNQPEIEKLQKQIDSLDVNFLKVNWAIIKNW